MATIAISDLRPIGSDLLIDSENYLQELSGRELSFNKGGTDPSAIASAISSAAVSAVVSYYIGRYYRNQ